MVRIWLYQNYKIKVQLIIAAFAPSVNSSVTNILMLIQLCIYTFLWHKFWSTRELLYLCSFFSLILLIGDLYLSVLCNQVLLHAIFTLWTGRRESDFKDKIRQQLHSTSKSTFAPPILIHNPAIRLLTDSLIVFWLVFLCCTHKIPKESPPSSFSHIQYIYILYRMLTIL